MKTSILNILVVAVLLTSCEKTVKNIKLEKKDPKLVLHGFFCPESNIVTNLTVSKSSLEGDYFFTVDNGFVDIFDNDELITSLEYDTGGFYYSRENHLQSSKEYSINAHAPDYPDVSCMFVIPPKVEILAVDTTVRTYTETWEWGETEERKEYTFHVKFNDSSEEENFYIVRLYNNVLMYKYDEEVYTPIDSFYDRQYLSISSDDISAEFGLHDTWIETKYEDEVYGSRGICFSDDFFSGKTKAFSFNVDYYEFGEWEDGVKTYYVALENISKDYYTFLKSMALYEDTEYDPFAQNVNVFTNVEGGFGIIGAYSQTIDSIAIGGK